MDWRIEDFDENALSAKGSGDPGKQQRFFAPGGQRNPLKRLKTDKEIQAFFFDLLCSGLAGFG